MSIDTNSWAPPRSALLSKAQGLTGCWAEVHQYCRCRAEVLYMSYPASNVLVRPVEGKSKMSAEEILETIDLILRDAGLTRAEFVDLGDRGILSEPELRDLWLIWGTDVAATVGDEEGRPTVQTV